MFTTEISVLSGSGGNVLSAAALAVKCAIYCASVPRVKVTGGTDGSGATVEVDETRRESIAQVGAQLPVAIKAVSTDAGYYCVDPCREEEAAASFETVVGVEMRTTAAATKNGDDDKSSGNNNKSSSDAAVKTSATTGRTAVTFSRIHSRPLKSAPSGQKSSASPSSLVVADMTVNDITTILRESASVAERLHEMWQSKVQ